MKKKGFTLTELLGVIVILSILALVTFPPIINQIRKARSTITDSQLQLIKSATESYITNHPNQYPRYNGSTYCITLQTLVDAGLLQSNLKNASTNEAFDLTTVVKVDVSANENMTYTYPATNCTAK